MIDSTTFKEIYNLTGEVTQNVSPSHPVVGIVATSLLFVVTLLLLNYKKIRKFNFSISK